YQKLIELRKELEVIQVGSYVPMFLEHEQVWAYRRSYKNQEIITFSNFYGEPIHLDLSHEVEEGDWKYLLVIYGQNAYNENLELAHYEAISFIQTMDNPLK